MSQPQTYTGWLKVWNSFTGPMFPTSTTTSSFAFTLPPPPPYIPGEVPDPFFHRKEAGEMFTEYFFKSQQIRERFRTLLRKHRKRIMDRRLIGEVDVGNLELIPEHHKVRVYDWNSKAVYQFHTHTIHRHIVNALRYQSYCISMPKEPRNPYTNVPWTLPQLLVLVDQIHGNMWRTRQRHMDSVLQSFRMVGLNMEQFQSRVGPQLDVECARAFFRESQGEEWTAIYSETLDDIAAISAVRIPPLIYRKLLDRTFPPLLLYQWDELLLGVWGYHNLNRIIIKAGSILDIIEMARSLLDRTHTYMESLRKKARQEINGGCT